MNQINILKTVVPVFLFAILGLFSCNEDKGNYSYIEINSVDSIKVNGQDLYGLTISRELGEILDIEPEIEFSEGEDESNFDFAWYYERSGWQLLQEGRNLEVEVTTPFDKPGNYVLAYEVHNLKTDITYRKLFNLNVVNSFVKGYLALCEEEGGFDIDMVALSTKNEFELHDNILDMLDSQLHRDGVNPLDIVTFIDPFAPDPIAIDGKYSIYILTDQYTTRLLPKNYSWKPSYDISNAIEKGSYLDTAYVQKDRPIIAKKIAYTYHKDPISPRVLLYHEEDNGDANWYLYETAMMSSLFSVQMNYIRPAAGQPVDPTTHYKAAPYVAAALNGVMYFDSDNKKFTYGVIPSMNYISDTWYYTQPLPAPSVIEESPADIFKYADPNDGLLQMDQILTNEGNSTGYAILKQTDGSFKYIEFRQQSSYPNMSNYPYTGGPTGSKVRASSFSAGSSIGDAKFFARMPEEGKNAFLYYVTNDNKVYLADVSSATAIIYDLTDQVLKDDGYNEITVFKFTVPETGNLDEGIRQALAVGTYNASLGKDKGGKLEFFNQEAVTGNLTLAKYPKEPREEDGYQIEMSWKDMGRIVGLSYKQQ